MRLCALALATAVAPVVAAGDSSCDTATAGAPVTSAPCGDATNVQLWQPLSPDASVAAALQLLPPSSSARSSAPSLCLDFQCDQTPCFVSGAYGPRAILSPCSTGSPTLRLHSSNKTIEVVSPGSGSAGGVAAGFCLDLRGAGPGLLQAYPCLADANQQWQFQEAAATATATAGTSTATAAAVDAGAQLVMLGGPCASQCITGCDAPISFCPAFHPIRDANVYDPSGPLLVRAGVLACLLVAAVLCLCFLLCVRVYARVCLWAVRGRNVVHE
jgi:hypothetical protein